MGATWLPSEPTYFPRFAASLLAPLSSSGRSQGAAAQPDEFSLVNDPPSDLGAYTAREPVGRESDWAESRGRPSLRVRNRTLALARWPPFGSGLVALAGVFIFLTGFIRLDCREIDAGCGNSSWHAQSHLALAALTALVLVLATFVVARALKLTQNWRDLWVPTLAFAIGTIVAGVAGSALGRGLGSLLAALVWFTWVAVLAVRMLRRARAGRIDEPTASAQAVH
jgi:hypothetical protein